MALNHPIKRISVIRQTVMSTGGNVIDIGCSNGEVFEGCDGMADILGIDVLKPKKPLPSAYNLGFRKLNGEKLPFKDKEFHLAVCAEILEHVPEPAKILKEAQRVANRVLISTPNEYNWAPQLRPFENNGEGGHIRYYRTDTIKKEIVDAGLSILYFDMINYDGWSFFFVIAA